MALVGMPPLGTDTGGWTDGDGAQTFTRWVGEHTVWERTLLGTSTQGRDVTALSVGSGPAAHTCMILGGVHGSEKMSSEAVLLWVRDVAERLDRGDAALEALLRRIRVVVIPMVGPDGRQANRYTNAQGLDIAQDGYRLRTPERQATNLAWRMFDPLMVTDHHEYSTSPYVPMYVGCNRGDVHPQILALSRDMMGAMRGRAEARLGVQTREYPIQNRRAFVHEATFRHAVGILIETAFGESRIPRQQAFDLHHLAIEEMLTVFDARIEEFKAARAASIQRALTSPGPERVRLDQMEARPDELHALNLWGYEIEGTIPERFVEAFGLEVVDGYVSMQQKARGFLPELFDPENSTAPLTGLRRRTPPGVPLAAYVMVGGQRRLVTQMFHLVDGVRRPVWFDQRPWAGKVWYSTEEPPVDQTGLTWINPDTGDVKQWQEE